MDQIPWIKPTTELTKKPMPHTDISLHYDSSVEESPKKIQFVTSLIDKMKSQYGQSLQLINALHHDEPYMIYTIVPLSANKGGAAEFLMDFLQYSPHQCVSFGDSMLDVPLFKTTKGGAVAVSNSDQDTLRWVFSNQQKYSWIKISKF